MVLDCVPGSRLVLKASNPTDSDTQRLLRRRMHRQGLDPEELIGLTSQRVRLNIYINILRLTSPLTLCLMVAVRLLVRLCGWGFRPLPLLQQLCESYEYSCLSGAEMSDWIAQDVHEYIQLASGYAADLNQLRNSGMIGASSLRKVLLVILWI